MNSVSHNAREENKNKFIKENYEKLGFSKRYIGYSEFEEIAREYIINKDDLKELINKANDEFIEYNLPIFKEKFEDILASNDIIDEELENKLKSDFYYNGYDFFDELECQKIIEEKNNTKRESERIKIFKEFDEALSSYDNIDDNVYDELKTRFNNFDYKFIKEFEFKKIIESAVLDRFNEALSSYEYIDGIALDELKSKFNDFNYKFINDSKFFNIIREKNNSAIKSKESLMLHEFTSLLYKCECFIGSNQRVTLKSRFSEPYYDFYTELGFDELIDEHNEKMEFKILKEILENENGVISSSRRLEIKSIYDTDAVNWNDIINKYNEAYSNENARSKGKLPDFRLNSLYELKSKIKENNDFQFGLTDAKRLHGTYYLYNYIKDGMYFPDLNQIAMSRKMWKFKDGYEYAIDFFTNELMEAVLDLINYHIDEDVNSIALVSVPPSKVYKNVDTPMRKSIYRIKENYDKLKLFDDNEKELYDYGNLLYRFVDVPTSHFGNRVKSPRHVRSILCTKDYLSRNMAFILMDDIIASGNIMNACKKILISNGAKRDNIYKLVIGGTIGGY